MFLCLIRFDYCNSFNFFLIQKECIPYSEQRCKHIAEVLGWTYSSGDLPTKGCHVNNGGREMEVLFGTGGTDDQNKMDVSGTSIGRPIGIDCKTGLTTLIDKHLIIRYISIFSYVVF